MKRTVLAVALAGAVLGAATIVLPGKPGADPKALSFGIRHIF